MTGIIFRESQVKAWAGYLDGRRNSPVAVTVKGKVLQAVILRTAEVVELTGEEPKEARK